MSRLPAGPAALRRQAEIGGLPEPHVEAMRPLLLAIFALAAALVVAISGLGVLAPIWGYLLTLAAAATYVVGLRSFLPSRARTGARFWLSPRLLEVAAVPLTALTGAVVLLTTSPGPLLVGVIAGWLFLVLGLGAWLDAASSRGEGPAWGPTVLSLLLVSVPAPLLVSSVGPGVAPWLVALGVAGGTWGPGWRLVRVSGRDWEDAALAALGVALLVGASAVLALRASATGAVLPAALLVGWYGLTGVASRSRSESPRLPSLGFVVLAALMLALTQPA